MLVLEWSSMIDGENALILYHGMGGVLFVCFSFCVTPAVSTFRCCMYEEHGALYQNCEIHDSWTRDSGSEMGPNGYIMKMHLKFRHHLYFCVLLKNTLCMIIKIMGPSTNIEKFLTPAVSGFQALRQKWVCKWVVIDFI